MAVTDSDELQHMGTGTGWLNALPKADLHLHQEAARCLDRVYARREGREPFDWARWRGHIERTIPPGPERLRHIGSIQPVRLLDHDDELLVARFLDLMEHAGAAGAHYIEIRCGGDVVLREGFMELFRRAEAQARRRYPSLFAEAIAIVVMMMPEAQRAAFVDGCIRLRGEGLAGVDFLYAPYDAEADWAPIYRVAERCAEAGLGITAHAGEMSTANIAAAVRTPGLSRIGHGIHAVSDPALTTLLVDNEIALECSISCNVFLGAVGSLEEHPLRRLIDAGVAVTLATDNPIQVGTDIGIEYALAQSLGLSDGQLHDISKTAFAAAFTSAERRTVLLRTLGDRP